MLDHVTLKSQILHNGTRESPGEDIVEGEQGSF